MLPKSRGGSNRIDNLTLSCHECNQKKDTLTAEEFIKQTLPAKKAAIKLKQLPNEKTFVQIYGTHERYQVGTI